MSDFRVKSSVHDYEVRFLGDIHLALEEELIEGDVILVDNKVRMLHGSSLASALKRCRHVGIDASEPQKSYQGIIPIMEALIQGGFKKNHRLVAVGGGITQDIAAFIASILYRGVQWLFYPTTLLAQGDSCIGSKTSINFGEYKNQVGGFYPPNKVLICPPFIETLEKPEIKSGLGEMLHYFIVSGREDFQLFRGSYLRAFHDKEVLTGIISRSLEIKKRFIEADEFDRHVRQVLNYGHSFGHAIESLTHFAVPHGIAVCFGMDMANFMSVKKGFILEEVRKEIREVLETLWQGYSIKGMDTGLFLQALRKDKKNVGAKLGLILNKGFGGMFKLVLDADASFLSWLHEYLEKEAA